MLSEKWRAIPIYRINNASFLRYLPYTGCTAEDVVEFYIVAHKCVLDAFVSLRKFIFYELRFRFILFLSPFTENINSPLTDLFLYKIFQCMLYNKTRFYEFFQVQF